MANNTNGNIWKVIQIVAAGFILSAGAYIWYASRAFYVVQTNAKTIEKIEPKVSANSTAVIEISAKMASLNEKVETLNKQVTINAGTQQQILTVQQQILREIQN